MAILLLFPFRVIFLFRISSYAKLKSIPSSYFEAEVFTRLEVISQTLLLNILLMIYFQQRHYFNLCTISRIQEDDYRIFCKGKSSFPGLIKYTGLPEIR